jgi:gluconate kinase
MNQNAMSENYMNFQVKIKHLRKQKESKIIKCSKAKKALFQQLKKLKKNINEIYFSYDMLIIRKII